MKKITFLSTAALMMILGACSDSEFDGYEKAENGLHYKFFNRDENGKKVEVGDGITIRYIISKQSNDSVVIDSKNVSQDGSGYVPFGMSKSSFVGSLEDGMMMMSKGDSASFIISADSFFLKTTQANELPKGFNPGEKLKAVIKIKDLRTKKELEDNQKKQMEERAAAMRDAESKEKPAIEKYIADNKITVQPRPSGLYFIETKKGSGPSPKPTDSITFHYTGKLLDGTVFDSSIERGTPIKYPLNQLMPGWIEAVQLMKKGGKANLVIPSSLGYGPEGRQGIPPYAPLAFEVELIEFKSNPGQPAQQMPGMPGQ